MKPNNLFRQRASLVAHSTLQKIIDKGGAILYDGYLQTKVPQHSNNNAVIFLQGFVRDGHGIRPESQNHNLSQDNMAPRSMSVTRSTKRGDSTRKTARDRIHNKFRDSASTGFQIAPGTAGQRDQNNNSGTPGSNITRGKRRSQGTPHSNRYMINIPKPLVVPLYAKQQLSQQERLEQQMADRYRKKRQYLDNLQRQGELNEQLRRREAAVGLERLRKYKQEVEKKGLQYTYDQEGSILMCDPLNHKHNFRVDSFLTQVRYRFASNQNIQKQFIIYRGRVLNLKKRKTNEEIQKEEKAKLKNEALVGDVFKSLMNVSLIDMKETRKREVGSDFMQNEVFNNSNCRQTSSIPLIQLSPGVAMNEPDGSFGGINGPSDQSKFNRTQYMNNIQHKRFRSFMTENLKQAQDISRLDKQSFQQMSEMLQNNRYRIARPLAQHTKTELARLATSVDFHPRHDKRAPSNRKNTDRILISRSRLSELLE